jgi:methyl-accepting chemotaxis protein
MREIKDGAGETSSAVKKVTEEAARLEELSTELKELVSHFRI